MDRHSPAAQAPEPGAPELEPVVRAESVRQAPASSGQTDRRLLAPETEQVPASAARRLAELPAREREPVRQMDQRAAADFPAAEEEDCFAAAAGQGAYRQMD